MPVGPHDLRSRIVGWDGRTRAPLEAVAADFGQLHSFLPELQELARDNDCADAATWLLKNAIENGAACPDLDDLLAAATQAEGWAAKLHVLQILERCQPDMVAETPLAELVAQACASDRPMLRAWGYAGADILGRCSEERRENVRRMLARAREVETAGSVRARLKRCTL